MCFRIFINLILIIFVISVFSVFAESNNTTNQDIQNVFERAKEYEKEIKPYKPNEKALKEAKKTYNKFNSSEYKKRLKEEETRLKEMFDEHINPYCSKCDEKNNKKENLKPLGNKKVYVFISSSIPISTLRNYAIDMDRLKNPNIVMIMRGFIGGMKNIKPTYNFLRQIILKNRDCNSKECKSYKINFEINPLKFNEFNIKKVPAFVYFDRNNKEKSKLIYGDIPLSFALEKFNLK